MFLRRVYWPCIIGKSYPSPLFLFSFFCFVVLSICNAVFRPAFKPILGVLQSFILFKPVCPSLNNIKPLDILGVKFPPGSIAIKSLSFLYCTTTHAWTVCDQLHRVCMCNCMHFVSLTLIILYRTEVDITYQMFDPGISIASSSGVVLSTVVNPCDK